MSNLSPFRDRRAKAMLDLSADLPHQQNEQSRQCQFIGCSTMTTRAHAVCASHVMPTQQYGCCARCKPAFFGSVVA